MKTLPRGLVVLAMAVAAACGGQSQPADADASIDARAPVPPRTICDGSDDLRLEVTIVAGGSPDPALMVLMENGPYILIDGHCRFWVYSAEDKHREVRTGVLDSGTLGEFADDFRYDRWPELQGSYFGDVVIFDADSIVFVDRETTISCVTNCIGDSTPAAVVAMREAYLAWNARLWAAGEAVTGDVRTRVLEFSDPELDWCARGWCSDWPASVPIESIAEPEGSGFAPSVLLTGPDADALRALRQEYLLGRPNPWGDPFYAILLSNGDGQLYLANVRDTTPFEDERGFISWLPR